MGSKHGKTDFELSLKLAIYEADLIKTQLEALQKANDQQRVKYYNNGIPMHLKEYLLSQLVHPAESLKLQLEGLIDSLGDITDCVEKVIGKADIPKSPLGMLTDFNSLISHPNREPFPDYFLESSLELAILGENYEDAAIIRDELIRRGVIKKITPEQ